MNRYALIVGLEHYAEKIKTVRFAENDARKIYDCFLDLGIDSSDVTLLLSAQATKSKMESEIRRLTAMAKKDDEILIFFAGHGVAINGSNYITCYDTIPSDLANSCISLQWLMNHFKRSASTRKILFLDSCHSGLKIDASMRGVLDALNESEIDAFFGDAEYEVGFAACRADQFSYSSPNLNHGIWTFHLLEALRGDAPGAVGKDKFITSASLQNFLASEVPKTLKVEHPDPVLQTPKCFGSFSKEFRIFNLSSVLARKEAERKVRIGELKSIDLVGSSGGSVRNLSGFRKGYHKIPDAVDGYTRKFVEDIASSDLEKEATEIHDRLKANFQYKRKEIKLVIHGSSAVITTKDFELSIYYTQDQENAAAFTVEYKLTNIKDDDALINDGLQRILSRHFDEVRFTVSGSIDIEEMIDAVEAQDRDDIDLVYPPDFSSLKISIRGCDWSLLISSDGASIVSRSLESPKKMLGYLKEGQTRIAGDSTLRLLIE